MDKIKVFVAHGWEEHEKEVADFVISIIKDYKDIEVSTGEKPRSRTEKFVPTMCNMIDDADVTLCIFAKRFKYRDKWLPSLYVISESGFSLGRYLKREHKYVHAFCEKDVDPDDMALIGDIGITLTSIDLDEDKRAETTNIINDYVKSLINDFKPIEKIAYKQDKIDQVVTIFNSNHSITKTRVTCHIQNPDLFDGFHHLLEITRPLNRLKKLAVVPIEKRFRTQFFASRLIGLGYKSLSEDETQMQVEETEKRTNSQINFKLTSEFLKNKKFKENDVIVYEYAWGRPNLYSPRKNISDFYDYAFARTLHGELEHIRLQLNFERGLRFEKAPIYATSPAVYENSPFGSPHNLDKKVSLFYDSYTIKKTKFWGTIKVSWIKKINKGGKNGR